MRYDNDPLRDFCLRLAHLRQELNTRREENRQLTEEGYDRIILEAGCTFLTSGQHLAPRRQTRQLEGCGPLGPRHPAPALFVLACDLQVGGLGGRGRCALVTSVASTVGLFADTLAMLLDSWMVEHGEVDPMQPWRLLCAQLARRVPERQHAHWSLRVGGRRSPGHPWEEAQRLARANGPTSTCDLDIPATFRAAGIA